MTSGAPERGTSSGPFTGEAEAALVQALTENLTRPVGIDVWTRRHSELVRPDRDACDHCDDQMALIRQFVRVSPLLTVTTYDLDRHAARAAEVGVDLAPATIVRCAGRSVQFVGLADGTLLRAFLDVMTFLSAGRSPLSDESREVLTALAAPIDLELLVAPYDQLSGYQMRLVGALAVESRMVRVKIIDATEYPMFAALRSVTEVPVLTIGGRRFAGIWDEPSLVEQVRRIATGNDEVVQRGQPMTAPFVTEAELRASQPPEPSQTASSLYIPGRD